MRGQPRQDLLFAALAVVLAFAAGLALGGVVKLPSCSNPLGWHAQLRTSSQWVEAESPNYVRVAGPAVVDGRVPEAGTIIYQGLDSLGRAGRAAGTITHQMMVDGLARERSDISQVTPTGWYDNQRVEIVLPDGSLYHGYFWNRSHLIAKSLGGNDSADNLITGTRMQNVGANDGQGGMAYVEGLARRFLEANPAATLYYSATPVYEGADLVCKSVIVDMRASDGSLDMQVEVYNAAKGFSIDYATGRYEHL